MKQTITHLVLFVVIMMSFGCKKLNQSTPVVNPKIFLAGYYETDSSSIHTYPVVWKDSTRITFDFIQSGFCTSIFVTDNDDIYSAGYKFNSSDFRPFYWKNGNAYVLDNRQGRVYDVKANNEIVCAGGFFSSGGFSIPVYWLNGVAHNLDLTIDTGIIAEYGVVNSILLSGNDVYAGGYLSDTTQTLQDTTIIVHHIDYPIIWKNGQIIFHGQKYAGIECICFYNNNIYCSGYWTNYIDNIHRPACWENGTLYKLSSINGDAPNIVANDSIVVVTGYLRLGSPIIPQIKVWKNRTLLTGTTGNISGQANASAILGGDIYTVGQYYQPHIAFILKNGVDIGARPTTDYYSSIFIK